MRHIIGVWYCIPFACTVVTESIGIFWPARVETAHRLDPVLKELDAEMAACVEQREKNRIAAAVAERETRVIGVYRQVTNGGGGGGRGGGYCPIDCIRLLSLSDTIMGDALLARRGTFLLSGVSRPRYPGGGYNVFDSLR